MRREIIFLRMEQARLVRIASVVPLRPIATLAGVDQIVKAIPAAFRQWLEVVACQNPARSCLGDAAVAAPVIVQHAQMLRLLGTGHRVYILPCG